MAMIDARHVEWSVVSRLHDLLDHPPTAEHDVTLTYSLFSTILCWTCERLRDNAAGHHKRIWEKLSKEPASADPWHFDAGAATLLREAEAEKKDIKSLSAGRFLIGIRNAVAHSDHNRITPLHLEVPGRPDRRLVGFTFTTEFKQSSHGGEDRDWGGWQFDLNSVDMRRIGMSLAERFCEGLSKDSQDDARRHVVG